MICKFGKNGRFCKRYAIGLQFRAGWVIIDPECRFLIKVVPKHTNATKITSSTRNLTQTSGSIIIIYPNLKWKKLIDILIQLFKKRIQLYLLIATQTYSFLTEKNTLGFCIKIQVNPNSKHLKNEREPNPARSTSVGLG